MWRKWILLHSSTTQELLKGQPQEILELGEGVQEMDHSTNQHNFIEHLKGQAQEILQSGEGVQEMDPSTYQHNFTELLKGQDQDTLEQGEGVLEEDSSTHQHHLLVIRTTKKDRVKRFQSQFKVCRKCSNNYY